jgi:hypothetical protein
MARVLLELLSVQNLEASFPNKRTGQNEKVNYVSLSGVDSDTMDLLLKVKIFKASANGIVRLNGFKKGDLLNIKFRTMSENKFERCIVINAQENDVQLHQNGGVNQAEPAPKLAVAQ